MTDNITIVIATDQASIAKCMAIRQAVFVGEQGVPAAMEVDAFENTSTHFLAQLGSTPVATGRMRIKGAWIKFERIATLKDYRGRGIGQVLMAAMESHARLHFQNLTPAMHAQATAISFYMHQGWMAQGPMFMEAGIEHQLLIKASTGQNQNS